MLHMQPLPEPADMPAMHTPGPWTWGDNFNGLYGAEHESVLSYADYEGMWLSFNDGHDANARLIASAPELLEALVAIVRADDLAELDQTDIERAREAIRKATTP